MKKVEEEHKELFHYTTRNGLEGILSSQTLFATHYTHLNDKEEINRFRSALKTPVIERLLSKVQEWILQGALLEKSIEDDGGAARVCSIEADSMIDVMYQSLLGGNGKPALAEPFVFSFCSSGSDPDISRDGLLSQWRGYGREGGFALVFETTELANLVRNESEKNLYSAFLWGDVVYEGDLKKFNEELAEKLYIIRNFILEVIVAKFEVRAEKDYPVATEAIYGAFATCIALYKHCGFKEEKEVRIVGFRPTENAVKRAREAEPTNEKSAPEVRKALSGKKYVELFISQKRKLPIKKIIVGPQHRKEEIAKELQARFKDIKVVVSGIPYVAQVWEDGMPSDWGK